MNGAFKDYFSTRSNDYAAYRPKYPVRLVQELAALCPGTDRVWDCACGTGQLTVWLKEFFNEVIATDASAAQIENAERRDGVSYRVAPAESSGLPAGSVDLITVAQAAHWFDLEKFYPEVRRVLKPDGVLALITYGINEIDEPKCDELVRQFYHETLDDHWPPERRLVETGYRTLPFPFAELSLPPLWLEARWNFEQLFGYLTTWSAFKALEKSEERAAIPKFREALAAAWGEAAEARTIRWPLAIRAGRLNGDLRK